MPLHTCPFRDHKITAGYQLCDGHGKLFGYQNSVYLLSVLINLMECYTVFFNKHIRELIDARVVLYREFLPRVRIVGLLGAM